MQRCSSLPYTSRLPCLAAPCSLSAETKLAIQTRKLLRPAYWQAWILEINLEVADGVNSVRKQQKALSDTEWRTVNQGLATSHHCYFCTVITVSGLVNPVHASCDGPFLPAQLAD
jgi:hypothetical protein